MKKLFYFLFIVGFFFSFASASVSELNYFKKGLIDSSGNLIETSEQVSGVSVLGVVCADSNCASINSYLWGGSELYTSSDKITLVYPTTLLSSFGYGVYMYKDGYIPYEVEADWYGTGSVGPYNNYLSKKKICTANILDLDVDVNFGEVEVEVEVKSPINAEYDLEFMPASILDYHKTLIDVKVDVYKKSGPLVYSESKQVNPEFSESEVARFSFDLDEGEYILKVSSSLENEAKCLDYCADKKSREIVISIPCTDADDDGVCVEDDCDDNNKNVWRILKGYTDKDLDSYGVGSMKNVCSGNDLPDGYADNNADCDDDDASVWRLLPGYNDFDLDSYGGLPKLAVCSGNFLPGPYVPVNGDCDDGNFNVNPGVMEICDDGIDNNCDGEVDEGCDFQPTVVAFGNPSTGVFPLEVSFSCQGSGGNGDLEYFWDFGNGATSFLQNPGYTYLEAGNFEASCGVRDADGDEAYDYVSVDVGMNELEIKDLVCFDEVVEGHNQSCSVYVTDLAGNKVGNAEVEVFYSDGSSFGECLSNSITGACGVKDLQEVVGSFEVYAVASKNGFVSDNDKFPKFSYDVFKNEYTILGLAVYNDSEFLNEDYDFFRGEDLFVKFSVEDSDGLVLDEDLVSKVSLVSSLVGGRVDLEKIEMSNGVYYYKLVPIPLTHEFLGDSNVFAFVFNFEDLSGGQEEVSLMIRNNLPFILPVIGDEEVFEGKSFSLDLVDYENDLEDSGDDLRWEVVSYGSDLEVNLVGKTLFVKGLNEGSSEVVLRLFDLDGDYDDQAFGVEVKEKSSGSSGGKSCRAEWECSAWSECVGGYESRSCYDLEECRSSQERPLEMRQCFVSGNAEVFDGVISFGDFSTEDEKKGSGLFFVVGVLVLLILLILLVIFLLI